MKKKSYMPSRKMAAMVANKIAMDGMLRQGSSVDTIERLIWFVQREQVRALFLERAKMFEGEVVVDKRPRR